MGVGRCFGSGGSSSARYQQDEHAQGSATPRSPRERDPYQPVSLNDPAFAGLPRRVSQLPPQDRGHAINASGLQTVRGEAEQLRSQIAAQVNQEGPGLQPTLNTLNIIIGRIDAKLRGARGRNGPDEYREAIAQVRRDFNAYNSAGIDSGRHFGYSGQLDDYNPYARD